MNKAPNFTLLLMALCWSGQSDAQVPPPDYQPPVNALNARITNIPVVSGNTPPTNVPVPSPKEKLLSGPQRPGTQTLSPVGIMPSFR